MRLNGHQYFCKLYYDMKPIDLISSQINKLLPLMNIDVDTIKIIWPAKEMNRWIVAWSYGVFNSSSVLFMGTCTFFTEIIYQFYRLLFADPKQKQTLLKIILDSVEFVVNIIGNAATGGIICGLLKLMGIPIDHFLCAGLLFLPRQYAQITVGTTWSRWTKKYITDNFR